MRGASGKLGKTFMDDRSTARACRRASDRLSSTWGGGRPPPVTAVARRGLGYSATRRWSTRRRRPTDPNLPRNRLADDDLLRPIDRFQLAAQLYRRVTPNLSTNLLRPSRGVANLRRATDLRHATNLPPYDPNFAVWPTCGVRPPNLPPRGRPTNPTLPTEQ